LKSQKEVSVKEAQEKEDKTRVFQQVLLKIIKENRG
jgi:hypothetical protein